MGLLLRRALRRWRRKGVDRVHVGCGTEIIPGWWNIDIQRLPGVDEVLDVTRCFDFENLRFIFCEHFLEHLQLEQGIRFLQGCQRSLCPGGVLRLSTPNLDWVYETHYDLYEKDWDRRVLNTFMLNRAFYAWGHRFLYNEALLTRLLTAVGFAELTRYQYGESDHQELRGLERHDQYQGTPELPDAIVGEARKTTADPDPSLLEELRRQAETEFLGYLDWTVAPNRFRRAKNTLRALWRDP